MSRLGTLFARHPKPALAMEDRTIVCAIDQGTTGTRCLLFDDRSRPVGGAYVTHEQHYPRSGWVEHDPTEIWENTVHVFRTALADADHTANEVAAIGITNQRETTVLWDADTGEPVERAIVWQDRRTADRIDALEASGDVEWIAETTGLQPDAYFSATKLEWLLEAGGNERRARARAGDLRFGTIDTWLIDRLTGAHVTDVTNASRTMLFDIDAERWDDALLEEFDVPPAVLPAVEPSIPGDPYGVTDPDGPLGAAIPVTGALGDQQAALFGQTCFERGEAKNTYGTGSFLLVNTGTERERSDHGLLSTIAYGKAGEPTRYALEGSIFVTGAAVEWLETVGLIDDASETEALASSIESSGDVYVVPAFTGLGAPHWDQRARGTIVGLTRDTSRAQIVRATLESIGFQTRDVVSAMAGDADMDIQDLCIDGGAVTNDVLCQLQADILGAPVVRPTIDETTALGAAYAAGLAVGVWDSRDSLREHWQVDQRFEPETEMDQQYHRWEAAVERAKGWATPESR